ncbi:hypothetical protein DSLASN_31780 [Desulfoluna limicola]|uniref:Uncharacterized protein n=1 Tax=Desulfoluna limicola TaxID=2810562 RepID=A0ABN6F755_9BACT|nr:hypothetical protein DSLASN_31780 [Desulfoluna limicola]
MPSPLVPRVESIREILVSKQPKPVYQTFQKFGPRQGRRRLFHLAAGKDNTKKGNQKAPRVKPVSEQEQPEKMKHGVFTNLGFRSSATGPEGSVE